jgi:hypothetical protein
MNAIDVGKLPQKDSMTAELQKLTEYEPMVINWSPEWKYKVPKKSIADFLEAFYKKVRTISDKNKTNMEALLLKAVIEHYRYNLDVGDFFNTVIETIKKARTLDSKDYRPGWILTNHLYKGNKLIDSWNEFKPIVDSIPYKKLSPYFWEDYAAFCLMARMPANMKMAVTYSN